MAALTGGRSIISMIDRPPANDRLCFGSLAASSAPIDYRALFWTDLGSRFEPAPLSVGVCAATCARPKSSAARYWSDGLIELFARLKRNRLPARPRFKAAKRAPLFARRSCSHCELAKKALPSRDSICLAGSTGLCRVDMRQQHCFPALGFRRGSGDNEDNGQRSAYARIELTRLCPTRRRRRRLAKLVVLPS